MKGFKPQTWQRFMDFLFKFSDLFYRFVGLLDYVGLVKHVNHVKSAFRNIQKLNDKYKTWIGE